MLQIVFFGVNCEYLNLVYIVYKDEIIITMIIVKCLGTLYPSFCLSIIIQLILFFFTVQIYINIPSVHFIAHLRSVDFPHEILD